MPKAAREYVVTHHKSRKIAEAAKITGARGTVTYEAEVAGKDLTFDADGKFIK